MSVAPLGGAGAGLQLNGTLRCGVDGQLEHVRPRVVAHRVEIHLRAGNVIEVDLGGEQGVFAVHRPRKHLAEGTDDAAAARINTVSGASGRRLCMASMGNWWRRRCWQLDSTKQRPSMAMCCMVLIQLSRSSAVGAQ